MKDRQEDRQDDSNKYTAISTGWQDNLLFRQLTRIKCKLGSERRLFFFSDTSVPGLTAAIISDEDSLTLDYQDGPHAEHSHRPTELQNLGETNLGKGKNVNFFSEKGEGGQP